MVIEVRIVIISIGKKQEIKQICKLYSIIEGDEWYGKKQHEEDWLPTGLWGRRPQEEGRWEDETWADLEMMEVARSYI